MAGPRPMPGQQPQGFPQQYAPPPGYQPPKAGGSGVLKGCIIAFVVMFILGSLAVAGIGGLAWFGVSKASQALGQEVDASITVSDQFMAKLAAGDIKGAHSLCDPVIKEEALNAYFQANEKYLKANKGVTYKTEELMGISVRGAVSVHNNEGWVMLNPADLNGHSGVQVRFVLYRSGGTYRVKGFWLDNVPGASEAPLGEQHMPASSSGSQKWD